MIPSRRDFLQTSGWLLVSVGAAAVAGPFGEREGTRTWRT